MDGNTVAGGHTLQEAGGRRAFLIREGFHIGKAAVVVDCYVKVVVAPLWPWPLLPRTGLSEARVEALAPACRDAPQTLHIEVYQCTWVVPLIADDRTCRAVEAGQD